MDINLENKLIDSNENNFTSNIFLLFSNKFVSANESLISKISLFPLFSDLNFSSNVNKYKPLIRNIISTNYRRFCFKINDMAIFGNLNICDIILLSYTTIDGKNFINGIATLRINVSSEFVSIDYLCGDLFFSGIGSNLLSFIKLFTIHILNEKFSIILNSIDSFTTQNFYRSHFFYKISDSIMKNGHEIIGENPIFLKEKYNYIWKFNPENLEEKYIFDNFILPFNIKKISHLKYSDESEATLINELKILKPYISHTSTLVFEKGGHKSKYTSKKRKRKRNRNRKSKSKQICKKSRRKSKST
jgi:hypothetical protein